MSDPSETMKTIVVKRSDIDREHRVVTDVGQPDILIQPIGAAQMVLTRTARVYVQSLLGALGVVATGLGLPDEIQQMLPAAFFDKVSLAAQMAVAPATITFLQNVGEILTRIDERFPKMRG